MMMILQLGLGGCLKLSAFFNEFFDAGKVSCLTIETLKKSLHY
jgi:hypothetical protein